MDNTVDRLMLQGESRQHTLAKIHQVVASWGLKLPEVTPEPLHFGYDDFDRIGETEFNVNNNVVEGYCGKFMFLFAGQKCPLHHHRIKHETFFIVKGRVEMELDGAASIMEQGDTLVVDRNAWHAFTALTDSLILECSKPDVMDDSIFRDESINEIIQRITGGIQEPHYQTKQRKHLTVSGKITKS
jgi:mannose-6-phosphate isomerase-like protein (cupin superfamily)